MCVVCVQSATGNPILVQANPATFKEIQFRPGPAKYHSVISLIVANKILTPGKCSSLYGVPVAKIAFQKTAFAEIATIASMVPDADFKLDACQKRRK